MSLVHAKLSLLYYYYIFVYILYINPTDRPIPFMMESVQCHRLSAMCKAYELHADNMETSTFLSTTYHWGKKITISMLWVPPL